MLVFPGYNYAISIAEDPISHDVSFSSGEQLTDATLNAIAQVLLEQFTGGYVGWISANDVRNVTLTSS